MRLDGGGWTKVGRQTLPEVVSGLFCHAGWWGGERFAAGSYRLLRRIPSRAFILWPLMPKGPGYVTPQGHKQGASSSRGSPWPCRVHFRSFGAI